MPHTWLLQKLATQPLQPAATTLLRQQPQVERQDPSPAQTEKLAENEDAHRHFLGVF